MGRKTEDGKRIKGSDKAKDKYKHDNGFSQKHIRLKQYHASNQLHNCLKQNKNKQLFKIKNYSLFK